MAIEVRQIVSRTELEACYDLWATVFPEERWFFQERLDEDRTYHTETTWAAWVDGVMAAAIQIFPYWARYGEAQVRVGGIGSVATLPRYRHQGLAQLILRQQASWMVARGYDLSLLYTNIPGFYAQLGWRSLPEGECIRFNPDRVLAEPASSLDIERGDLERDYAVLSAIYDDFSAMVPFSRVRLLTFWEDSIRWGRRNVRNVWIARRAGKPVGYLLARQNQTGEMSGVECVYRLAHPDCALPLFHAYLRQRVEKTPVVIRLPHGHALSRYGEPVLEPSDTMWRLMNPVQLLHRIRPELNRRWAAKDALRSTVLALAVGSDILLRVKTGSGGVDVEALDASHLSIDGMVSLTPDEFLAMLLGGVNERSPAFSHEVLRILFPPSTPFLWEGDHF